MDLTVVMVNVGRVERQKEDKISHTYPPQYLEFEGAIPHAHYTIR